MKRIIIAAAIFAAIAPASAFSETERMSDSRYMAAARCVAYSDIEAIQGDGFDATALKTEVQAQSRRARAPEVRTLLRSDIRQIERAGARESDSERGLETLRERREAACASFAATGLVQLGQGTPAT